jgi:putative SOS response-associated peptidase YedK
MALPFVNGRPYCSAPALPPPAAALAPLLRLYPADAMRAYPVGQLVNNPRNDGPDCLAAV